MEQNFNPRLAIIGLSGTGPWCFITHWRLKHTQQTVRIHLPSTACDVISFNSQGQLCLLTWAEWNLVSFSFFHIREVWDSLIALRSSTPNFFAVSVFFEFVKNRKRWLWKPFDNCCEFLVASETNTRAIYTRKNKTRTVPFIRACLI